LCSITPTSFSLTLCCFIKNNQAFLYHSIEKEKPNIYRKPFYDYYKKTAQS